ncbi:MAG: hypothetical protein M0R16_03950 [Bacteroidales bacterium]|nr:hypothetical protein [Bacteroidales bacterium]
MREDCPVLQPGRTSVRGASIKTFFCFAEQGFCFNVRKKIREDYPDLQSGRTSVRGASIKTFFCFAEQGFCFNVRKKMREDCPDLQPGRTSVRGASIKTFFCFAEQDFCFNARSGKPGSLKTKTLPFSGKVLIGRGEKTRTSDPLHPIKYFCLIENYFNLY